MKVPVEERLHIEALRLMVENAKLRKTLNEYSEGKPVCVCIYVCVCVCIRYTHAHTQACEYMCMYIHGVYLVHFPCRICPFDVFALRAREKTLNECFDACPDACADACA